MAEPNENEIALRQIAEVQLELTKQIARNMSSVIQLFVAVILLLVVAAALGIILTR